ncbi:MAG: Sir2 family NAD-dependent protein deacetylase [Nitrospinota bacterium]
MGAAWEEALGRAAGWLRASASTVCLSGAGISTESGIPDFRSRGGFWSRFDPRDFEIRRWLGSEEVRRRYWAAAREGYKVVSGAAPSAGHAALARLAGGGRLSLLVTQNTDGLHQRAGHPPEGLVELHGTSHVCVCAGCGERLPRPEVQARVEAGEEVPCCRGCGGPLKPDAVFFGEAIAPERLARAVEAAEGAEVFLVVGSSLAVRPAAALPERALLRGARLIIVNAGPTRLDAQAHALLRGRAGEILPPLAEAALA